MLIKTKEEACEWINQRISRNINDYRHPKSSYPNKVWKKPKVKVPIYKKRWKKYLLSKLQKLFYKKAFALSLEKKLVSYIDFSKFIFADEWKEYEINRLSMIAVPKFVEDYKYCWVVPIVHEYCKEDLQYGVRPISAHTDYVYVGSGPNILDKNTGEVYKTGSGMWHNSPIPDFENYKEGRPSKIAWNKLLFKKNCS